MLIYVCREPKSSSKLLLKLALKKGCKFNKEKQQETLFMKPTRTQFYNHCFLVKLKNLSSGNFKRLKKLSQSLTARKLLMRKNLETFEY